jgi:thymidylate synthase ThyX
MYKCEIITDSLSPQGDRLTTFKLTYPRIIHAELMTHRLFSRNSASSRAIPFNKMVKMVEENPFIPIAWQRDHKGMQGNEYITDENQIKAKINCWLDARDNAIRNAKYLNSDLVQHDINGEKYLSFNQTNNVKIEDLLAEKRIDATSVTKQLCNRLLEPFMWHTVLVTATSFENFFELRCPKYQTPVSQTVEPQRSWKDLLAIHSNPINEKLLEDNKDNWTFKMQHNLSQADIHIQVIAEMMWDAYNESTPKQLQAGEFHIPFGDKMKFPFSFSSWRSEEKYKIKIATARCARLSYETLGDNPKIDYEADVRLHDMLLTDKHMSPFEHCARAMSDLEYERFFKGAMPDSFINYSSGLGWCNNFRGFIQYRYLIEENL